jgi:hypothetical protein
VISFARRSLVVFLVLATIIVARPSSAFQFPPNSPGINRVEKGKWLGVSTAHFELYSTNDEKATGEAIQRFELVYDFFTQAGLQQAGGLHPIPAAAVQVIAFSSESEYQAHRISPSACAYYQRTRSGDYIVMQDLAPEHYQIGVHEYTHYVFEHSGLKLPLWLSEGLADFYSSLESQNGQIVLGRPPFGRLRALRSQSWIDPGTLFAVTQGSPYYTQPAKMAIFYSESWALTHMLAIHPDYAAQFPRFLALISGGASVPSAFETLYRKSTDQVMSDLANYLQQRQLPARVFDLKAAVPSDPKALLSPQARVEFALADLAASNPFSSLGAASQLDDLSKKYPQSPEVEESLGFLALRQNLTADARAHFAKAVERHSTSPDVIFYLAHLDFNAGAPPGPVVDLLQRVLVLDPNHYNARLDLGLAAAKANQFELAVSTLTAIKNVRAEHTYVLAYTLAYCYSQIGQDAEARRYAEQAARVAKDDADRSQAQALMRYLDGEQRAENQRLAVDSTTAMR